jgi:hypothetical protein
MYTGANMGTVIWLSSAPVRDPVVLPLIPSLLYVFNVYMLAYRHPDNNITFNSV